MCIKNLHVHISKYVCSCFLVILFFLTSMPIWNTWPQHTTCYNIFALWFCSTQPAHSSFWFDIQKFVIFTEKFYCTRLIYRYGFFSWHWAVVSESLRSRWHSWFKNSFILLFLIKFISIFVQLLNFSWHLCLGRALLLNDWSIPKATLYSFSCFGCNIPLRITHLCSMN